MSKRGKAMGGRYFNIYRREVGGRCRFRVIITETRYGRRRTVTRSTDSLAHAVQIRDELLARKTLNQLPGTEKVPTLGQFVESHMVPSAKLNRCPADPLRYLSEIVGFFGASCPLNQITAAGVLEYREHLLARPCEGLHRGTLSAQSRDHRLGKLRHILNEAHRAGFIKLVPRVKMFGGHGSRVSTFTLEEFKRLLAVLPGPPRPHRAILRMGLLTGQRKSDLLNMHRGQIRNGRVAFKNSKSGKTLFETCTPRLKAELEAIAPGNDTIWLFPNPSTGRPYVDLKRSLQTACAKIGIKAIGMHDLRRLCADQVAKETGDRNVVQSFLGWSSISMVDRYTNTNNFRDSIAAAIEDRLEAL